MHDNGLGGHDRRGSTGRLLPVVGWVVVASLVTVVMVFAVIRAITDLSNLTQGSMPPAGDFNRRYAERPVLAYLHIVPGVLYLLGAPIQLSARLRNRDFTRHRKVGRIVLASGAISGVFAVAVGLVMSFGGVVEASAATVFGLWFLTGLAMAYRAIRAGDIVAHRRWMIRAFAVGLGVGSIRLWVGMFEALELMSFSEGFGLAFWLGLSTHAIAAEWWLRLRPEPRLGPGPQRTRQQDRSTAPRPGQRPD